jgi:hypothetical protein
VLLIGVGIGTSIAAALKWRKGAQADVTESAAPSSPPKIKIIAKFFQRHWLIFFAVCGYLITLAVCTYLDPGKGVPHNFITGVLPFVGTLVGAGVAFMSDQVKEDKRIEDNQVAAINRTMMALIAQLQELGRLDIEIRAHGEPYIMTPPMAIPENLGYRVTTDDLAFLVDHRQVEILSKLQLEQRRFDSAFFTIQDRNKIMVDSIQPKMAAAKFGGKKITLQMLKDCLGEFDYGRLVTSTNNVLTNVPTTVESCPEILDELTKIGKTLFPHRIIVKFSGFIPISDDQQIDAGNRPPQHGPE